GVVRRKPREMRRICGLPVRFHYCEAVAVRYAFDAPKSMKDSIVVRGARQNTLKGFDIEIPRRTVTVLTGPSGSGKSSLAFDTIYAEGQRRYVESLSSYARQF